MAVERIYPHGDHINFERHVARYEFARSLKKGEDKTVLDFMCGCGYGSHILAETGCMVVGFDRDIEAINYAQRHYDKPVFLLSDWKTFRRYRARDRYDYIVVFEAVEHIEPEETELYFAEIRGLLGPEGRLIISTPCNGYNGQAPDNEFHTNTFTPERYKQTLLQFFGTAEFYKQDGIDDIHPVEEPQGGFSIAVCR